MTHELATRSNGAAAMAVAPAPESEVTRLYKRLAAPMQTRTLDVPGRPKMPYVEVEAVISRLNSVLGPDAWSFAITERWHEADSDCCCTRGLLTIAWPSGRTTHHEDVGGQIVNRRKDGTALEMSNDWKGSQSDCLKRCATQVGVGLFLRTKTRQVSELPDDRPERDRTPPASGDREATGAAASVPAVVAQGEGTGGVGPQTTRHAATPPAQPAASEKRWTQHQLNYFWAQLRPLAPKVTGDELHGILSAAAGHPVESIHDWHDLDDALRLVFAARQGKPPASASEATKSADQAPGGGEGAGGAGRARDRGVGGGAVGSGGDAAVRADAPAGRQVEHPAGSIEAAWQRYKAARAEAERWNRDNPQAAFRIAPQPPENEATEPQVTANAKHLEDQLARAFQPFPVGGGG